MTSGPHWPEEAWMVKPEPQPAWAPWPSSRPAAPPGGGTEHPTTCAPGEAVARRRRGRHGRPRWRNGVMQHEAVAAQPVDLAGGRMRRRRPARQGSRGAWWRRDSAAAACTPVEATAARDKSPYPQRSYSQGEKRRAPARIPL